MEVAEGHTISLKVVGREGMLIKRWIIGGIDEHVSKSAYGVSVL